MGKFLRVLVIILTILSIGALTLGILLFGKREVLKGRTQKLEQTLISLGPTLEVEGAKVDTKPDYVARDVDETTAEPNETPKKSAFWETYQHQLELADQPTLDVAKRKDQLKQYYKLDPVTQKPAVDLATGMKIIKGEGTMQEVLDEILKKSEDQLNRLNETRHQLRKLREELVDTITELNGKKKSLREALFTITERDRAIVQLEEKIKTLETKIEELDGEIRRLNDTIAEQKQTITERNEKIEDQKNEIKVLEKRIAELMEGTVPGGVAQYFPNLARGTVGQVVSVNKDWNFVVLRFSDAFIEQMRKEAERRKGSLPKVDLIINRKVDGKDVFVTKVKLDHLRDNENVGVADVLTGWQQTDIQEGDLIVY